MRITILLLAVLFSQAVPSATSAGDASIADQGNQWILETSSARRVIAIDGGRLLLKSLEDKATGQELIAAGTVSDEFSLSVADAKQPLTGGTGPWKLIHAKQTPLAQGARQLDVTLQQGSLRVTKSYVVYPGSSVVREWVTLANVGREPLRIVEPAFLSLTIRPGEPAALDFHWMTGGENAPGSWRLKTEKLDPAKPRTFDSYERFGSSGTDNKEGYGFRMASSSYAPWYAFLARDSRQGVVIGWDYFGHWASSFRQGADGTVAVQLKVAGHRQTLAPGESLTTPKAFAGLFHGDLDEAGNEVLDWQYRHLWDYTRDGWFPAIRMVGYWMRGTGWGQPGVGWLGGNPDWQSTFRKVFRVADLMRYTGADVYHRDWGWWDRAGDWNGPDFRATGDYLRKYGMGQLIYAFPYTVHGESKVAREHPDWVLRGDTLDMSRPEVVNYMVGQLDQFVERWGDFEWRNDSTPTAPRGDDDTPLLGQDAGLREVIRRFLDRHPGCAFQAVNGGGNDAGYDYARYASTQSFSDGQVGILRNYYAALLLPPDKTSDIPDIWNPNNYDKATWRGLLCINFDMTGDTWDPAKLEGIRELIDIYHYLHKQGVVGRWVKVYRPVVSGDDPTMYFQRLSGDRRRGIIIPKRPAPGAFTLKPKGLLPAEKYLVSFHESAASEHRLGAELMEKGITCQKMAPGELIYLNLPLHPGSKLDRRPPSPPRDVQKQPAENMGFPGVELTWQPGSDDNWVSYYEVFRNGAAIDKLSKGTYYFDHSAGADLAASYEIRTVDGAGNPSTRVAAAGPAAEPVLVVDDVPAAVIKYTGSWRRQSNLQPAHLGTVSSSNEKDATVELTFEGKRILWFAKYGPDGGTAAVSVDGATDEIVDTYSADDIWGVCVYRKELPGAGRHMLRITVLGEHGPRATDSQISIDGFRAEK